MEICKKGMPEANNNLKPQIIVFDVYETLLDMSDVERKVNTLTDSIRGYILWFELFMQYCCVGNSTGTFHDFISIAKATLQMTGNSLGRNLNEAEVNEVLELLKHLPVQEDVQETLSLLSDKGVRIAALTNAPEKIVCDRMERTGLISYFENVLSAEKTRKYKPEVRVYNWAAERLGVPIEQMLMVTAHGWDIAGASCAGMRTAFLKRGAQILYPLSPQPDRTYKTLTELAGIF